MTSIISSLTGQFGRAILLSVLLPVTVFVLLALALVWPEIPPDIPLVHWAGGLDPEWKLAAITLAVVLLTMLLYTLNGQIIRFYEGYPWSDSFLGIWRSGVLRRRLISRQLESKGLWALLQQSEAKALAGYRDAGDYWNQIARELNTQYPDRSAKVLPTRLGNVIRSFESYPSRQYRIQTITVWPRLVACMDKDYAEQIGNMKSSFDFTLNGSFLSALLAVLILAVHLTFPVGLATLRVWPLVALEIVILLLVSYGFYLAAISRASSWGMVVKGAFDLFRWKLLESLGYRYRPETLDEERALWEWISTRLILSDLAHKPHPGYVQKPTANVATSAQAAPADLPLELTRGARAEAGGALTITIRVVNRDTQRSATALKVIDTLPDGWLLEWGSVGSSLGAVRIMGTNPYIFDTGGLAAGGEALVSYRILPARQDNLHP